MTQVIMITFLSVTVLAQPASKELPKEVASAFSSKYPATAIKNWHLKNDDYVVKFKRNDKTHFAFYAASGAWLKTETNYAFTHSLPVEIKNGWKKTEYRSWIVNEIKEVESAGDDLFVLQVTNSFTYDADHLPEKYTYNLYFSKTGQFVKKQEVPWGSKEQ